MHGAQDPELLVRWVQFGVFSPVMRLHSSNNPFMNKEPWTFSPEKAAVMKDFLRLRHRLIPWLYSMNLRCSAENTMLLRPLYYDYPQDWGLYFRRRNQYLLGDCLTVCPVTRPLDRDAQKAETDAWLPEGLWTDFFSGLRYQGGRQLKLYRPLETLPVLVKAGGILPMDGVEFPENGVTLPEQILLRLFPAASGETELLEDNGLLPADPAYRRCVTRVRMTRDEGLTVEILPPEGETAVLPEGRRYTVELNGFADVSPDESSAGYTAAYDARRRALTLSLAQAPCVLHWKTMPEVPALNRLERLEELLQAAWISYDLKSAVMQAARQCGNDAAFLAQLHTLALPPALTGAVLELYSAC